MARPSWYVFTLFIILLVAIIYSFFVFVQNQTNWFLTIAILWAILLPIICSFPYGFVYFFSIPAPFLGTVFSLMMVIEKYVGISVTGFLIAVFLSFVLVTGFHIMTRKRTMFWKLPMSSLSRLGIATSSLIFLILAMAVISPPILGATPQSEFFFLAAGIFGYVATSMLYVNSSYRLYLLSNRIGTFTLNKLLSEKWKNIEKKFPSEQKDVNLLRYCFNESFTSFLDGNFEKSFVWGYMVIREKTIVDPTELVNDKREGKSSFAEIRTTLQHSRRGDKHIETERIRKVMKNLSDDALDLLEREISLINKVAE